MISTSSISPESAWLEFDITENDIEFIYNLLLEREKPLTTPEMAEALIGLRISQLEREAQRVAAEAIPAYLPKEPYQVGDQMLFSAFGNRKGKVVALREGQNPELGEFDVISVEFDGGHERRDFASRLESHRLNDPPEVSSAADDMNSPQVVLSLFGSKIYKRLDEQLVKIEDIVRIAGRWFPRALLADVHEGHLNLAEAVLDVSDGGPLPTHDLLEHLEMPSGLDPLLAEFSIDYALQEDERFDEVGPAGQILWHLKRLEPPEVLYPPERLKYEPQAYDRSVLPPALLDLEARLDDELSPNREHVVSQEVEEVTLALLFPHWRVGTLPLSQRLRPLFPTAYEAPRIRFMLVDGRTGESFPGWVVREESFVFGLDEWYQSYDVPAGGLITVRRGDEVGQVIVETAHTRSRNDWIRTVSVNDANQIGFTMLKQPVGTDYDDLMIIGLIDPAVLDEAWMRGSQRRMPFNRLVAHVFRELAKLNPQSAVHAQALYSAVNVIRRMPPGPIFAELVLQPYYIHVGDLYWRFDESAWSAQ